MIMSSTLVWEPYSSHEGEPLPDELKRVISRKYWDSDGSVGGSAVLSSKDIPYLEGVRDCGVKGASQLIDLINEYGQLRIWHTY